MTMATSSGTVDVLEMVKGVGANQLQAGRPATVGFVYQVAGNVTVKRPTGLVQVSTCPNRASAAALSMIVNGLPGSAR